MTDIKPDATTVKEPAKATSKTTTKASPKTESKSHEFGVSINLCDGNKGGVGKSMLCRTLFHWLEEQKIPLAGLEADTNSPDFYGVYKDRGLEVIEFSEDENKRDLPNLILELTAEEKKTVIVNLPATVHESFKQWLDTYSVLDLLEEYNVKLIKWFVVSGEYDSLKSLENSLHQLGSKIQHIVVKNQKFSDWSYYDENTELIDLIKASKAVEIELPPLPVRIASTLLRERLAFDAAQKYRGKNYGIAEQAALKTYLKKASAQFEKVRYLL